MNDSDYSRPSGFARWGWVLPAVNVLLALLNLAAIAFADGSVGNWLAAGICAASAVACWWMWRDGVASDLSYRRTMAALNRDRQWDVR